MRTGVVLLLGRHIRATDPSHCIRVALALSGTGPCVGPPAFSGPVPPSVSWSPRPPHFCKRVGVAVGGSMERVSGRGDRRGGGGWGVLIAHVSVPAVVLATSIRVINIRVINAHVTNIKAINIRVIGIRL